MSALYFASSTKKSENVSSRMAANHAYSKGQLNLASFYRNLLVKKCLKRDQKREPKIG